MNDQRSLTDQLETLYGLANKNGLYDAADWLRAKLDSAKANLQGLHLNARPDELNLPASPDVVDDGPVNDKPT